MIRGRTSAPAVEIERAPDYAEPFVAWRVWRVVEHAGELALASVVKRTIWPAGRPLTATCLKPSPFTWLLRRTPHEAPAESCECGVYGATADRAAEYLNDSLPDSIVRVIGRVLLWGSVVECERGFRAAHAYPEVIYVPLQGCGARRLAPQSIAGRLERYGVAVELLPGGPWSRLEHPGELERRVGLGGR
jgi:hypothetical protein